MGAVQSGKTASMLAVTAMALDEGVDAVIILAGTRTSLWLQTLERLNQQLDVLEDAPVRRLRLPNKEVASNIGRGPDLRSAYGLSKQLAARAVLRRRPLVAVVMKHVAHLEQMARTLHEAVYRAVESEPRPFHLLVIDDEADDSSVEDARLSGPDAAQQKQVPRRVLDLWETRARGGETALPNLYATYVAYTATPQANFLQDPTNPLAPRDFVVALRTPGAEGDVERRSPSYRVPEGLPSWYTGGQVFYHSLESTLCVATDGQAADESLVDSVRAYLVASAIRLLRSPARLGPSSAENRVFPSRQEARERLVAPMSMLVHPSSVTDEHFNVAARILAWSRCEELSNDIPLLSSDRHLGTDGVELDMQEKESQWVAWLERYAETNRRCHLAFPNAGLPPVPGPADWPALREVILAEVVPGTRVAVINSSVNADDRPEFDPVEDPDGWRAPRNLSTIFVSGNVMSRGLTLEGLSTTLFTRTTDEPLADTQMQMQRWFGYRGRYIDVCRVFAASDQLTLFKRYHDADEALRRDIIARMGADAVGPPDVRVLQGRAFKATGKIAGVRPAELWPGPRPFVRYLNPADRDIANHRLVKNLFEDSVVPIPDSSASQGLLLGRRLDLLETAELLNTLSYDSHGPGSDGAAAMPWRAAQHHLGLEPGDPEFPLFRAPAVLGADEDPIPSPYAIASYLRLWSACLDRRAAGFMSTDEPPLLWSLVDLQTKRDQAPTFAVGLRFGSGPEVDDGPLSELPWSVRSMERAVRDDYMESTWGSRGVGSGGILGDEFFDYYGTGETPSLTPGGVRAAGSTGLVLFHPVHRQEGGVSIAVGLSLPAGGPTQVQALRPGEVQ
jgi:hypothetical protein